MRGVLNMSRMSWEQICKVYKNQHVCLSNIEWRDRPHGNVKTAEIVASEKDTSYYDLLSMAMLSDGSIICKDTYNDIFSTVGTLELCT